MFLFKLANGKNTFESAATKFGRSTTTDSAQNWFGGKILKISPDGKLLHLFEIAAGDCTTNVAFGEGEKELYVTMVKDPNDLQAKRAAS
jgi:sugar lactone lactonase YvrE